MSSEKSAKNFEWSDRFRKFVKRIANDENQDEFKMNLKEESRSFEHFGEAKVYQNQLHEFGGTF